jgi:hypothetical protein
MFKKLLKKLNIREVIKKRVLLSIFDQLSRLTNLVVEYVIRFSLS